MKQYIFLTNQYLPRPGATGMCVHSIASELVKRGYVVTTLCYSEDANFHEEQFDGVKVYKIPVPKLLRNVDSTSVYQKYSVRFLSLFAKIVHVRNYPLRSKTLVNRYVQKIIPLLSDHIHTAIVASYTPLEGVLAMLQILNKYNNISTIFYSTDTLSNERGNAGLLPASFRTKMGLKWEKMIFDKVDKAIIMECHKEYYYGNQFRDFHEKMYVANFPLLKKSSVNYEVGCKKEIKSLVYAGTLYRDLRNPTFVCKLLNMVSADISIHVTFMGGGDCDDIMQYYSDKSAGKIEYLGMQPYSIAIDSINQADILISIGNKKSPMAPSKIYEYMSTGKPIIHVYSWKNDPCIEPLSKYGNSFLIDENESVDIESFKLFIEKSTILSYDQVKKRFYTATPEYSADLVEGLLNK